MAEYIELEALLADIDAAMDNSRMGYVVRQTLKRYVKRQPAADVVEVVHGEWEDYHFIKTDCPKNGFPTVKCSNCEIVFCDLINNHHFMYHYCPHCGAKMDGE